MIKGKKLTGHKKMLLVCRIACNSRRWKFLLFFENSLFLFFQASQEWKPEPHDFSHFFVFLSDIPISISSSFTFSSVIKWHQRVKVSSQTQAP